MRKKYAQYLTRKTQVDYNLNSVDFANARKYLPQDLKDLVKIAKKNDLVLDAGCGSGYLYPALKKTKYIGVDFSQELIKVARKRYPEVSFEKMNILKLNFKDNYFDKIFSIGVLHQIPSTKKRMEFLKEIRRVLKKNGVFTIRVWNLWEKKRKVILKYFFHPQLDFKDMFLPKNKMYYHAFTLKELEKLVKKAGFSIQKSYIKGKGVKSNLYIVAVF